VSFRSTYHNFNVYIRINLYLTSCFLNSFVSIGCVHVHTHTHLFWAKALLPATRSGFGPRRTGCWLVGICGMNKWSPEDMKCSLHLDVHCNLCVKGFQGSYIDICCTSSMHVYVRVNIYIHAKTSYHTSTNSRTTCRMPSRLLFMAWSESCSQRMRMSRIPIGMHLYIPGGFTSIYQLFGNGSKPCTPGEHQNSW
jgi:hypothetical protein